MRNYASGIARYNCEIPDRRFAPSGMTTVMDRSQ
jgi:hypothetical protein